MRKETDFEQDYESPAIETDEIEIEKGFAVSNPSGLKNPDWKKGANDWWSNGNNN